VAESPVADTVLHWPDERPSTVDFVRDADRPDGGVTQPLVTFPPSAPAPAQPREPVAEHDATRPADR
jgi:hypothetical protein